MRLIDELKQSNLHYSCHLIGNPMISDLTEENNPKIIIGIDSVRQYYDIE